MWEPYLLAVAVPLTICTVVMPGRLYLVEAVPLAFVIAVLNNIYCSDAGWALPDVW